jgi:DNA-directed RNA polymerase specialized sigma24 family protein
MNARTNPRTDPGTDGTWASYDEAADLLGMTRGGVRNLARKRCWPRQSGNDGKTRILVPADAIPARTDAPHDAENHAGHDPGTDARTDAVLTDALSRLSAAQGELVEMARKLGMAEGEIAGLRAQADEARKHLEEIKQDRDRWHAAATAPRSWWPWRRAG